MKLSPALAIPLALTLASCPKSEVQKPAAPSIQVHSAPEVVQRIQDVHRALLDDETGVTVQRSNVADNLCQYTEIYHFDQKILLYPTTLQVKTKDEYGVTSYLSAELSLNPRADELEDATASEFIHTCTIYPGIQDLKTEIPTEKIELRHLYASYDSESLNCTTGREDTDPWRLIKGPEAVHCTPQYSSRELETKDPNFYRSIYALCHTLRAFAFDCEGQPGATKECISSITGATETLLTKAPERFGNLPDPYNPIETVKEMEGKIHGVKELTRYIKPDGAVNDYFTLDLGNGRTLPQSSLDSTKTNCSLKLNELTDENLYIYHLDSRTLVGFETDSIRCSFADEGELDCRNLGTHEAIPVATSSEELKVAIEGACKTVRGMASECLKSAGEPYLLRDGTKMLSCGN